MPTKKKNELPSCLGLDLTRRIPSRSELQSMSDKRQRQITRKEKDLQETSDKIYNMKDEINNLTKKLKETRQKEKAYRLATSRLKNHNEIVALDRTLRPPDREYPNIHYSNMDKDIWRYDQLREWFQSDTIDGDSRRGGIAENSYTLTPSQTGYTLRLS